MYRVCIRNLKLRVPSVLLKRALDCQLVLRTSKSVGVKPEVPRNPGTPGSRDNTSTDGMYLYFKTEIFNFKYVSTF